MSSQGNASFISLRGISKSFKTPSVNPFKKKEPVRALAGIDLDIPKGTITCLLGPNGAGKTTLIKILASLITPDSGEIAYSGTRPAIGMVTPNERSFYWRLSGRENLLFYGRLHNHHGAALKQRVSQTLAEVGMSDAADKPYRLYSAGMKQKVNIARALLGNPQLYLLDEPAAHLDPIAREEFRRFILEELVGKRKATVFLCTHDLEEARALGDLLVVLDKGKIVARGERDTLFGSIGNEHALTISYKGDIPPGWPGDGVSVDKTGPNLLRVRYDPEKVSQERLIADFVARGGRLLEAFREELDLLDFIKKATNTNA